MDNPYVRSSKEWWDWYEGWKEERHNGDQELNESGS